MSGDQLMAALPFIFITYIMFLFSLTFHEFAHAWVAERKGDSTARVMGRLTMNPFPHMDLLGTVILPLSGFLGNPVAFGWAKPVPVNERNLRKPKPDLFWISLAGPMSNLLLAIAGAIVCAGLGVWGSDYSGTGIGLRQLSFNFIAINMMLCFFNLIPLHPLDGGKIIDRFLPAAASRWLEDHALHLNVVLIGLFLLGMFRFFHEYVSTAALYLVMGVEFVLRLLF